MPQEDFQAGEISARLDNVERFQGKMETDLWAAVNEMRAGQVQILLGVARMEERVKGLCDLTTRVDALETSQLVSRGAAGQKRRATAMWIAIAGVLGGLVSPLVEKFVNGGTK